MNHLWYLLIFLSLTFFTAWLNIKFIDDTAFKDQYWHKVQLYQQVWTWVVMGILILVTGGWSEVFIYALYAIAYGLMYMFIYNSALNLGRHKDIDNLGTYDVFKFKTTVFLFLGGVGLVVLYQLICFLT